MSILYSILLIAAVILIFNLIIFVHELGHFLAAKWRGVHADRFQIWFGKPIWKKTIGGVQYGLGWIPAGGFVSLPQMAPMESIEGQSKADKLPPIKPIDKIIVAFAGPLFSILFGVFLSFVIWIIGYPEDSIPVNTVGYVQEDSPAEEAGFKRGDKILKINGHPVEFWHGKANQSIVTQIILSEGDNIDFEVEREGKIMTITSKFTIPKTKAWERRGYRKVGIGPKQRVIIGSTLKNSPAKLAGLIKGDELTHMDGEPIFGYPHITESIKLGKPIKFTVLRDGKSSVIEITPQKPKAPNDKDYTLGFSGLRDVNYKRTMVNPNPKDQILGVLDSMRITVKKVSSPKSSIGIQHLNGPVGIFDQYYQLISGDKGLHLVIWFSVLLNINLAIINLLPFPILDGGHISMAAYELFFKKPIPEKVIGMMKKSLESLQHQLRKKRLCNLLNNERALSQNISYQPDFWSRIPLRSSTPNVSARKRSDFRYPRRSKTRLPYH